MKRLFFIALLWSFHIPGYGSPWLTIMQIPADTEVWAELESGEKMEGRVIRANIKFIRLESIRIKSSNAGFKLKAKQIRALRFNYCEHISVNKDDCFILYGSLVHPVNQKKIVVQQLNPAGPAVGLKIFHNVRKQLEYLPGGAITMVATYGNSYFIQNGAEEVIMVDHSNYDEIVRHLLKDSEKFNELFRNTLLHIEDIVQYLSVAEQDVI